MGYNHYAPAILMAAVIVAVLALCLIPGGATEKETEDVPIIPEEGKVELKSYSIHTYKTSNEVMVSLAVSNRTDTPYDTGNAVPHLFIDGVEQTEYELSTRILIDPHTSQVWNYTYTVSESDMDGQMSFSIDF